MERKMKDLPYQEQLLFYVERRENGNDEVFYVKKFTNIAKVHMYKHIGEKHLSDLTGLFFDHETSERLNNQFLNKSAKKHLFMDFVNNKSDVSIDRLAEILGVKSADLATIVNALTMESEKK